MNQEDKTLFIEENIVAQYKTRLINGEGVDLNKYQSSVKSPACPFTFLFVSTDCNITLHTPFYIVLIKLYHILCEFSSKIKVLYKPSGDIDIASRKKLLVNKLTYF